MLQFLKKSKKSVSPSDGFTLPTQSGPETSTKIKYKGNCDQKHWPSIEYAFTIGGTDYFCWNQDIMITWQRMEAAKSIYRELEFQMNPAMLKLHFETVESILKDEKMKANDKMFRVAELNSRMKECFELSIPVDTQIKLATVKFFDSYEDPFSYDYKYNLQKIKHWSESTDLISFFLSLPQNQYVESSRELQENLVNSLLAITTLNLKNMEFHSMQLNSEFINPVMQKELDLQKEWEQLLKNWSGVPITNTI